MIRRGRLDAEGNFSTFNDGGTAQTQIDGFEDLEASADNVMAGILSAGVRRHC
jgi:hypothetical protein